MALADKLDTLAGIFAIGQKPTGTKDPFGLRRAAIGVLRILIEKKLDLDLRALVNARAGAAAGENRRRPARSCGNTWSSGCARTSSIRRAHAAVANVSTEMFDAVRAGNPVSPLDFAARLRRW